MLFLLMDSLISLDHLGKLLHQENEAKQPANHSMHLHISKQSDKRLAADIMHLMIRGYFPILLGPLINQI